MNQNLVEMVFILDRSGSMEHLTEETIGGFNSLVEKQKNEEGEAAVTTVLFDDMYEILHEHRPIQEIERLTRREYYARGCTALLDAVGLTIDRVGNRFAELPEEERPGKVVVVITTDGYENASRIYTKERVKTMIELQQNVYKWQFLFLGANIDAVGAADSIGIRPCMARNYTASPAGVESTFRAAGNAISFMRVSGEEDNYEDEMALFLDEIE